jgi:hypothetical protein
MCEHELTEERLSGRGSIVVVCLECCKTVYEEPFPPDDCGGKLSDRPWDPEAARSHPCDRR